MEKNLSRSNSKHCNSKMASSPRNEKEDAKAANYLSLVLSASATAVTHPMQMTKVMIQVGYEPAAPVPYKTFLGKKMYKLPGFLTYVSTFHQVDGVTGLFRGVTPRLASALIGSSVNNFVVGYLRSLDEKDETAQQNPILENSLKEFAKETCYQSVSRVTAITVTYPLQVVSLRMMLQFVGRETKYCSILQSVRDIYKEEGITGLFAGLIPQLIGELLTLWFFRGLTFCVNRAITTEIGEVKDLKVYTQQASQIIVSSLTYPFVLVSNLMAVNQCRLTATCKLPKFDRWTDCWSTLRAERLLWRGSSVFRRTSVTDALGPLTFRKIT